MPVVSPLVVPPSAVLSSVDEASNSADGVSPNGLKFEADGGRIRAAKKTQEEISMIGAKAKN